MEIRNVTSDRYAQLKESGQLPKFLRNVLSKYSSAIVREDLGGPVSVFNSDIVDQANNNLDFFVKESPNTHREGALRKLMYDLLPAKNLFEDSGDFRVNLISNNKPGSGQAQEPILSLIVPGRPVFDGNSSQINRRFSKDKDEPKTLSEKEILVEVVKKDTGGMSTIDEKVYYGSTRYKLARLSLVFNKSVLNFLFNQIKKDRDADFDSFIEHIRSGDIPLCLITSDETKRIKAYFDYRKKAGDIAPQPDTPPPLPAVVRMVHRYKSGENLDEIFETLQKEEPYASERYGKTINYLIVPVNDTDDAPETLKNILDTPLK